MLPKRTSDLDVDVEVVFGLFKQKTGLLCFVCLFAYLFVVCARGAGYNKGF